MWTVYYHQNKINNKIYVGITSIDPVKRWGKDGCKYKHNIHFYSAILKYGWNNFYHEIFASNLTKEEAENIEQILISKLDLTNRLFGYNIEIGGFVKKGVCHNSDIAREAARSRFKKVECIEDHNVFETITDCSSFYGLSRSAIRRSAQRYDLNKQHEFSHTGHHFRFV